MFGRDVMVEDMGSKRGVKGREEARWRLGLSTKSGEGSGRRRTGREGRGVKKN